LRPTELAVIITIIIIIIIIISNRLVVKEWRLLGYYAVWLL
jgi:hypothetical protein